MLDLVLVPIGADDVLNLSDDSFLARDLNGQGPLLDVE